MIGISSWNGDLKKIELNKSCDFGDDVDQSVSKIKFIIASPLRRIFEIFWKQVQKPFIWKSMGNKEFTFSNTIESEKKNKSVGEILELR